MRARRPLLSLLLLVLAGCPERSAPAPLPAPSASGAIPASSARRQVTALQIAENRRDPSAISEADLGNGEVHVRRATARALARIGSEKSRAGLLRLLSDEDAEVVAFVAYGLGWTCREHEEEHRKALVARSLTLPAELRRGDFDAHESLARALGRCGGTEVEGVLVSWLRGPHNRAAAAAFALGDIASRNRLQEDSYVALTQAASEGLGEALYLFGRVDPPSEAVTSRVREVAIQQLSKKDASRIFAIRALGRCGEASVKELKGVLTGDFQDAERAEAARSLARLGDEGQEALAEALPKLLPAHGPEGLAALVSDGFGVLTTLLSELRQPGRARTTLLLLAQMPLPDSEAPPALARRVIRLRCLAARIVAPKPTSPVLLGCDPTPNGTERDLARLAMLKRDGIKAAQRIAVLRELVASKDARVRSEALEALGIFKDLENIAPLLLQGLKSPHPGTVAAAANALALRPETVIPPLEAALLEALTRPWKPDETETIAALLRAVGALRLAKGRPELERYCTSSSPTLRANAQAALSLLGERKARCTTGDPWSEAAPELKHPLPLPKLVLDTDAGEMTITVHPELAPTASVRLLELAEAGFFNEMAVHRVVPGFVVQFGDRTGDGTGGAGKEALRCETSPLPFQPLSVGVALSGRDTGSSQFFVTLTRTPHLDGEYTLLGTATGDWAALTEGDQIRKIQVVR